MPRKKNININDFYYTYKIFTKRIKNKLNNMINRCENTQNHGYKYYGQRGIKVCSAWKDNPEHFIGWYLENNYILGLEIHRLNPHKNYEPDNCILCTKEDHIYYHQLIKKDRKKFNESLKVHHEVQKLFDFYSDSIVEISIKK